MTRPLGRAAILAGAALLAAACAATYEPPTTGAQQFSRFMEAERAAIFAAAKTALVLDGYQILSSDEAAGVISTAKRQIRLSELEADCGTTMGLPYIKDARTVTTVSFGIVADNGRISIKSNIEGEYLKANVVQSIALSCVSTGALEERIFTLISP